MSCFQVLQPCKTSQTAGVWKPAGLYVHSPAYSGRRGMDCDVTNTHIATKLIGDYSQLYQLNSAEIARLYTALEYDEELSVEERLAEEMENIKAVREIATMPVLTRGDFLSIKATFGYY